MFPHKLGYVVKGLVMSNVVSQEWQTFGVWCVQSFGLNAEQLQELWIVEQLERSSYGMESKTPHIGSFRTTIVQNGKFQEISVDRFSFLALCNYWLKTGKQMPDKMAKYLKEAIKPVLVNKLKKAMPYSYKITDERIETAVSSTLAILFGGCENDAELRSYVIPTKVEHVQDSSGILATINDAHLVRCSVDGLAELIEASYSGSWVMLYWDKHKIARVSARPRINVVRSACNYVALHFVEMEVGRDKVRSAPEFLIDNARRIVNESAEGFPIEDFLAADEVSRFHQAIAYAEHQGGHIEDKLAHFAQYYGSPIKERTYYEHRKHAFAVMERWLTELRSSLD